MRALAPSIPSASNVPDKGGAGAEPLEQAWNWRRDDVADFYRPDLGANADDPFARDGEGRLVRRGYWLDMADRSLVLAMTRGIGARLSADQKRAHLADLGRAHLIGEVCTVEILPPEK